jgi:tetratricopeptide (TPR) repeat protein
MKSRLCVVLFLLAASAAAQLDSSRMVRRVRVRVSSGNGICEMSAHVRLMGLGGPVAEGTTNDQCEVEFFHLPEGHYHLAVSGDGGAHAESGEIDFVSGGPDEVEVRVTRPNDSDRADGISNDGIPGNSLVSVSDLSVPSRARKDLDKATELIGKREWAQAIQKLNQAISISPSYAVAYNNLGVIYSHMGDAPRELEALQKAISLNDHFALAYVNLGRMLMAAGDFPAAEAALDKASAFDPRDPMALILLSYAEFMDHHFDEAIATSRKAHALEKPHAFVHRVAARAFEQKRQGASAIGELELFLKEEPPGLRADAARKELQTVEAVLPAAN